MVQLGSQSVEQVLGTCTAQGQHCKTLNQGKEFLWTAAPDLFKDKVSTWVCVLEFLFLTNASNSDERASGILDQVQLA